MAALFFDLFFFNNFRRRGTNVHHGGSSFHGLSSPWIAPGSFPMGIKEKR